MVNAAFCLHPVDDLEEICTCAVKTPQLWKCQLCGTILYRYEGKAGRTGELKNWIPSNKKLLNRMLKKKLPYTKKYVGRLKARYVSLGGFLSGRS